VVVGDAGRITPIVCTDGGHSLCDTFDETSISGTWIVNGACADPFLDTSKFQRFRRISRRSEQRRVRAIFLDLGDHERLPVLRNCSECGSSGRARIAGT
jgi:hypothetical protein